MAVVEHFAELRERARELRNLEHMSALLEWDQRVMMPGLGAAARGEQLRTVASIRHQRLTDAGLGRILGEVDESALSEDLRAEVRNLRREHERAVRVPPRLADDLAEAMSAGYAAWIEARPRSDFSIMAPALRHLIELKREESEAVGYAEEPYDAHLDQFEPGARVSDVEPMLTNLASDLRMLISRIEGSGITLDKPPPGPFPESEQLAHSIGLASRLGYDLRRGRVDLTAHPFASAFGPGDARITVRFKEDDLFDGMEAAAHEAGHAMYEQGLPASLDLTYAGQAPSYGAHESQSRFWENHVFKSRPYWTHELPLLVERFPGLARTTPETIYAWVNRVERGYIRVEADEVTYPLHVQVRFEVEVALFRGEIGVDEMPTAFREGMRRHLGVEPPDDRLGVLQDVHWAEGMFGYFPSYVLGSIYAASLFEAACAALGGTDAVNASLAAGENGPLLGWLRQNVHCHGGVLETRSLMQVATGSPAEGPVDTSAYIRHLAQRYGGLYGFTTHL
ncbi:MAG: carboxypeptidase M32 [Candidatus Dormibacteria bacterium]